VIIEDDHKGYYPEVITEDDNIGYTGKHDMITMDDV
jgi:hypothetical protein